MLYARANEWKKLNYHLGQFCHPAIGSSSSGSNANRFHRIFHLRCQGSTSGTCMSRCATSFPHSMWTSHMAREVTQLLLSRRGCFSLHRPPTPVAFVFLGMCAHTAIFSVLQLGCMFYGNLMSFCVSRNVSGFVHSSFESCLASFQSHGCGGENGRLGLLHLLSTFSSQHWRVCGSGSNSFHF